MRETYVYGDPLLIKKNFYLLKTGDAIYFEIPISDSAHLPTHCVQRVAGMPGDTIEIKSKTLFVNDSCFTDSITFKHNYFVKLSSEVSDKEFINSNTNLEGDEVSKDHDYCCAFSKSQLDTLNTKNVFEKYEVKTEKGKK